MNQTKFNSKFSKNSTSSNVNSSNHANDADCDGCEGLRVMKQFNPNNSTNNSTASTNSSTSTTSTNSTQNHTTSNESMLTPHDFDEQTGWRMKSPPDITALGNGSWTLLHTMAAYYPQTPSEQQKRDTNTFLHAFANVFPCKFCAADFQQSIKQAPPLLDSQQSFSQWLCRAHNQVNVKLGKPEFDCQLVDKRWKREKN